MISHTTSMLLFYQYLTVHGRHYAQRCARLLVRQFSAAG